MKTSKMRPTEEYSKGFRQAEDKREKVKALQNINVLTIIIIISFWK